MDWSMIWWFFGILKREKPQVVHTHASLSGRIAARLARVPVSVMTRHWSLPVEPNNSRLFRVRQKFSSWINALLSDAIIAVSQSLGDQLLAAGLPDNKVWVIHNGIMIDERGKSNLEKSNLELIKSDSNSKVVGTVGRLEPEKGHEYFLKAASQVLNDHPNTEFWIIGAGSREEELKKLAANLHIETHCKFLGFRADATDLVQEVDVYVLSSLTEALPLALLEAMAKGKPVVATQVGGVPEIVDHEVNGWLVGAGDAEELAKGIGYLIQNPEQAQTLARKGQETVLEKFDARLMAKKTERLYQELRDKRLINK